MKKQMKLALLFLAVLIVLGGIAAYLFTVGPFGEPVLARVNGEKITVSRFEQDIERTDRASREMVREFPGKFLDIIVNQTLLLQEAKKEGVTLPPGAPPSPEGETVALIEVYLDKKVAGLPPVSDGEIEKVYKLYEDRLAGRSREEGMALIRRVMERQRKGEAVDKLIEGLRKSARIEIDEAALKKVTVVAPGMETQSEEAFRKALADGRPVIVDFGSNSSLPCRQLRPVLQKIRQDHEGKLAVLVIDVAKNEKLGGEYQIKSLPTVIFFDAAGKEFMRHEGFMNEAMIKEQLAKLGVV